MKEITDLYIQGFHRPDKRNYRNKIKQHNR